MAKAANSSQTLKELWPGQSVELLKALHILTREGTLNADSRRKLKQVQHLVQLLKPSLDAIFAAKEAPVLADLVAGGGIAAVAGYPSITVPLGLREIPASTNAAGAAIPGITQATGMMFFGTAWSEPKLIKYAYAFEQMTKGRVTPQFLPTFPKKKE